MARERGRFGGAHGLAPCKVVHADDMYFVLGGKLANVDAVIVQEHDIIDTIDGCAYVKIDLTSKLFQRLTGQLLRGKAWLSELRTRRETAIYEFIKVRRKAEGMSAPAVYKTGLQAGKPIAGFKRLVDDFENAPNTVDVTFPPDEEGGEPFQLPVLFTTRAGVIAVPLRADVLDFVVAKLHASGLIDPKKRKRCSDDELHAPFTYPEIKWVDGPRQYAYVVYVDADDRVKRKACGKIKDPFNATEMNAICANLHAFYMEHHHPESANSAIAHLIDANDVLPDAESESGSPMKADNASAPSSVEPAPAGNDASEMLSEAGDGEFSA